MSRLSSSAPQIGAALGAGLMVLSAMAFRIGVGTDPVDDPTPVYDAELQSAEDRQFFSAVTGLFRETPPSVEPRPQGAEAASPQTGSGTAAPGSPRLAIILDDVADLGTAEAVWALPVPVTVSILPYAEQSRLIASRAGDREVFLHLPMEPVGLQDPGPFALTKALEGETLSARVQWALSQVPGASGFNNHMGSRLTADETAMAQVFGALQSDRDQLIFVDSLTHPASVARESAIAAGFRAFDRDIFLDHDPDRASIDAQLDAALAKAVETGQAIAIGHPRAQTLALLESLDARAQAAGVEIVPVRALVAD